MEEGADCTRYVTTSSNSRWTNTGVRRVRCRAPGVGGLVGGGRGGQWVREPVRERGVLEIAQEIHTWCCCVEPRYCIRVAGTRRGFRGRRGWVERRGKVGRNCSVWLTAMFDLRAPCWSNGPMK